LFHIRLSNRDRRITEQRQRERGDSRPREARERQRAVERSRDGRDSRRARHSDRPAHRGQVPRRTKYSAQPHAAEILRRSVSDSLKRYIAVVAAACSRTFRSLSRDFPLLTFVTFLTLVTLNSDESLSSRRRDR